MAQLTIRPATEDDRQALEELITVCYAEVYPGWYDAELLVDALPRMLRVDAQLLASGRYLAAYQGSRLAGCGGWSEAQPGSGTTSAGIGHIRHFATHPDLMRKGVGGAILEACIEAATKAGLKQLQCFSSLAAEEFYARHGFVTQQDVTIMLDEDTPFPAKLMMRELG